MISQFIILTNIIYSIFVLIKKRMKLRTEKGELLNIKSLIRRNTLQ